MKTRFIIAFIILLSAVDTIAQDRWVSGDGAFVSYGKLKTWGGVVSHWHSKKPKVHVYDYNRYFGHAQYVSSGLGTGISFKQFKERVKAPGTRQYVPFFLFDLRPNPALEAEEQYTWAVRIEDYGYQDNEDQMHALVTRLMTELQTHLSEQGESGKGLLILSKSKQAQPNTGLLPKLAEADFGTITLADLLSQSGADRIQILNPGKTAGRLRYVAEAETNTAHFKADDIVIFERLPRRVPPVQGIITLEPQTPLSHVNLLAKNRGTVNIYALSIDDIPGAEQMLNKPVKLTCLDTKLTLGEITEGELRRHMQKVKRVVPDLPAPNLAIKSIIPLDAINANTSVNVVGAKASNYARIQVTFPEHVKPALALPFHFYFSHAAQSEIKLQIEQLLHQAEAPNDSVEVLLGEVRKAINRTALPAGHLEEIKAAINQQFPNQRVRLRSSTNCEDLAQFNGAGLYLSRGWTPSTGDSVLERKLKQVYASLWTPHAWAERNYYQIDHKQAGMAILLSHSYQNEFANGVVLTIPHSDLQYSVLINSQPGENSVTNPKHGDVPESILFKSSNLSYYQVEAESSIGNVFHEGPLSSEMLTELKELTVKIHELLTGDLPGDQPIHYGVDIEFKVMIEESKAVLYLKQARLLGAVLPE